VDVDDHGGAGTVVGALAEAESYPGRLMRRRREYSWHKKKNLCRDVS
jgi:hypothetical protein